MVAQTASCPELEKINREKIESVKFRYFDDAFINEKAPQAEKAGLLDLDKMQKEGNASELYDSEEELLEHVLKNKHVKHHRQLRFLAGRHESAILKLRFVLAPFSFVFLLAGEAQFHIVLETLDREEATYVWHLEKDRKLLPENSKAIDEDLAIIRNKGRQAFLADAPKSFSRIIHSYSDERKGFILWRDMLEEKLY